ncbi:MAG: FAD-dependent oxidoreductase, partial [Pseudomonadota bacterium]
IAVEFAGIFHALGVKTTLVYRGQQILRGFDNDMRHWLSLELVRQGINLVTETTLTDIEKIGRDHVVSLSSGRSLTTDLVVFAIGRDPNTQGLGLETAGVEVGRNGRIEVDAHSKTSADNIYAVGDVTDRVALTPVAIKEGAAFVETVFKDNPTTVDHDLIASAVFSQPQIGTVGLTEAEARERFSSVDIYKTDFRPMKNVLAGNDARMVMKMVVDGETDRVLGIHILGPDAAEMVQGLAVALRLGATKADFDATMPLHPSSAEELMTMRTKWEPPKIDREAEARRAVS